MKRFIFDHAFVETPDDYHDNFASLFTSKRVVGTLSENSGGPIPNVDFTTLPSHWCLEL